MTGRMRVGLFITNQHYLDKDMVSAFDEQIAMVRMARDFGWDSLFSGQHYLNEGNNRQLQSVPLLARLAAEAGEMTVGLGVLLLSLHNPVYVAETVASLDVICRGNFVFGVGLGYRDVEFDAFGVPKGSRLRRFEQCLEVVQRLWEQDEVTFESDVCKLNKVRMNLKPVQRPRPPIWLAANGDKAVQRAAALADAWFIAPHATDATVARQMQVYRAELKRLGKPFPAVLPCAKEIFCAKDRKTALETAGPYLAGKYKDYAKWGQDKVMPKGETFNQSFEDLLGDRFVLGSPQECFEQLSPMLKRTKANHLIFRTHWAGLPLAAALSSMRLISTELMPELRRIAA